MSEYLTVRQIADKIGYCYQTVQALCCRGEFSPYRIDDRPLKIQWIPETQNIMTNLIKKKG